MVFSPASALTAAFHTSARAAATSHVMSASCFLIIWKLPIFSPNAVRWLQYSRAASRQACARPTWRAATVSRPKSIAFIATVKPCPSSPNMYFELTRTSSSVIELVGMSLPSTRHGTRRTSNPGVDVGTTNAVTPL